MGKAMQVVNKRHIDFLQKINAAHEFAEKLDEAIALGWVELENASFYFSEFNNELNASIDADSFNSIIDLLDRIERYLGIEFDSTKDYPDGNFRSYNSGCFSLNVTLTGENPDQCVRVLDHVETVQREVYKFVCA